MLIVLRTLALVLVLLIAGTAYSQPQQFQQAPPVKAEQISKGAIKPQENTEPKKNAACDSSASTPIFVTCVQANPAKQQGENSREEGNEFWSPFLGYRVKVTDSLLALFTFLLWWSTWSLVKGAKKTAERQLRAYVFTDSTTISDPNATGPIKAIVTIKNSGQTPAYNFTCTANISLFDFPVFVFPDHEDDASAGPKSITDIPPGGKFGGKCVGGILSDQDKLGLQGGVKAIYVWGKVKYRDAFGNERFTEFRYMCGGNYGVYSGEMFACKDGNKAD